LPVEDVYFSGIYAEESGMPGGWIKLRQEEIYMQARIKGYTQIVASAKARISERSGRNIEHGKRRNPERMERWRSRPDPLAGVWENELKPMLEESPTLAAMTLLEHLQDKYPGDYPDSVLRTLQRRVKEWRALHGPEKEVMFRQVHEAGRQGLSDFTKLKKVTVTIVGQPFDHLLYHFRLAYSHWSFIKVIQGGESYPALAQGLQEALQALGGCPKEHRTDSLSAAFKNLSPKAQEDMTIRYDALCRHYGMTATRNNRGKGHENGSVESSHGHLKRRIEQALLLRGSTDFESIEAYQTFIDVIVAKANRRNAKLIHQERQVLLPLPQSRATDYSEQRAIVSSSSTIEVRRVIYTVPSRLQGEVLNVRIYDDRLVCYLGAHHVVTLQRVHLSKGRNRGRQVDYRHVIHSLVKKPQAFRYSQLRDELLPNADYRFIWQAIDQRMAPQEACKFIVGLLHLAATCNCEESLGTMVVTALQAGQHLSLEHLQKKFCKNPDHPQLEMQIVQHSLETYNQLIPQPPMEVCHHA
jgi:hypothetical protein